MGSCLKGGSSWKYTYYSVRSLLCSHHFLLHSALLQYPRQQWGWGCFFNALFFFSCDIWSFTDAWATDKYNSPLEILCSPGARSLSLLFLNLSWKLFIAQMTVSERFLQEVCKCVNSDDSCSLGDLTRIKIPSFCMTRKQGHHKTTSRMFIVYFPPSGCECIRLVFVFMSVILVRGLGDSVFPRKSKLWCFVSIIIVFLLFLH